MSLLYVPQMHYHYFMDDDEIPLAALIRETGDSCDYVYDLGDGFYHKILVEQVIEDESSRVVLLEGAGPCPPEDSNGLEYKGSKAYAEFLAEYKQSPNKASVKKAISEIETMAINYSRPWMGPPIKFSFDIDRHRLMMRTMLQGPTVQNQGMLRFGSDQFKESMRGCAHCGDRVKALQRCSRCREVWYCGRECQVAGWKSGHKKVCKVVKDSS